MFTQTLAVAALAAGVAAQGVTSAISPSASAPAGCSASYDGKFMVTVAKVSAKRDVVDLTARDTCGGEGILVSSLSNGVMLDAQGRTAYIASNYQFQYDKPAQAGAIYTAGFSACNNGSIALGGSTTFFACVSGDFSNLYDRTWAAQCSPVEMLMIPCGSAGAVAGQGSDGQVVGTQIITTTIAKQLTDGQPQIITTTVPQPLCQIGDGQAQVKTTPCASITTTVAPKPTNLPPPVSQYSDGQIQVTAPASVPTVAPPKTTAAPAPSTSAAAPPPPPPPASSSVASSAPVTTAAPMPSSTLKTSASSASSASTAAPTTSAPATAGANAVEGSFAALIVGMVGAVAFL